MATFRFAAADDTTDILSLIRELADYEKLAHEVTATEDTLRETLFGTRRTAEVLLAYEKEELAGFCLFFHNFSTFLGKPGLYIEDLYLRPAYRGSGLGTRFFRELAAIAKARGCGRMEWWVLDWNEPAIHFYRKLGAKPMSEWTVYRLTEDDMAPLLSEPATA